MDKSSYCMFYWLIKPTESVHAGAVVGLTPTDPCGTPRLLRRMSLVCKNVHERIKDCDLSSDDDSTFVAAFFLAKHNKRRLVTQRDNKASFRSFASSSPVLFHRHPSVHQSVKQPVSQSVSGVVGPPLRSNMKVRFKFKFASESTAYLNNYSTIILSVLIMPPPPQVLLIRGTR